MEPEQNDLLLGFFSINCSLFKLFLTLHRPEFLDSALYEFNFFSVTQYLSIVFVSLSDGK